jgi:hypothetical protein
VLRISDANVRRVEQVNGDMAYEAALDSFLDELDLGFGRTDVVKTFHAVRNFPYFSSGDRSPEAALRDRRGACTAKHILLRDLLRRQGEIADVEIVEGDFAISMPLAKSMPEELQSWIKRGGITDFHCYVVWRGPEREQVLDCTWPNLLKTLGFPVNSNWTGKGDTDLAIEPRHVKARIENVIERKELMLSKLSQDDIFHRKIFLSMLSEWLAGLQQ